MINVAMQCVRFWMLLITISMSRYLIAKNGLFRELSAEFQFSLSRTRMTTEQTPSTTTGAESSRKRLSKA